MLERQRELDELDARIGSAIAGDGGLVVVEGPAGIGKSRLLARAREYAEGSMHVFAARGGEMEQEFAFGVVRQLFETELTAPGKAGSEESPFSGAAAPAAVVFGAPGATERGASFAALHGLYWLVLGLAEGKPLLLVVDDLHWCDRPSLLFLAYLARRVENQPVLLLLGLREGEPGTDSALMAEIVRDPAADTILPAPLSKSAVASFIEHRLESAPDQAFAAACHEATGGNPLLLAQLGSALRDAGVTPDATQVAQVAKIGPRAVSRTVLRRLVDLGPEAGSVAAAVAILGDAASLGAVSALAGVEGGQLAEAGRALARADILAPEPPFAFVHPLVRDAVYHDLSPAERELDHTRAAEILRDSGAPREQVAAQLLKISPRGAGWAAELLWEAGREAMRTGAADSAVTYLRRALDEQSRECDRGRLLFELGVAETLTTGAGAAEHLALAYDELTDPESRSVAVGLLARTLIFTGEPDQAVSTVERALAKLPDELVEQRKGLEALQYMAVFFGARGAERLSGLRQYRHPPAPGFGSSMLAAMASWEAVCTDGRAEDCASLALAALADEELQAADGALVPLAAMVTLVVSDRPEVSPIFDQALADAHRCGSLLSASSIHLWHGFHQLRSGDLTAAEESVRAAELEFTLWGHDHYANINSRSFMADIMRERGQLAEAMSWLERVGSVRPESHSASNFLTAKAALLTANGRAEEAATAADELGAHCEAVPDSARLWWRSFKAEALDQLGLREEAIVLTREELAVTRAFGAPSSLGRTLRVLGTLERAEGLDTLAKAVDVLRNSTARLEYAKALAALGTGLRLARRPTQARPPLRQALELAAVCGADGLAKRVRSELYASGSRPRREALSGVDSLTPSERRAVGLAAAGRTNREIAQELFVTPKTIELHLRNAYHKLGVRSRRELDPALADGMAVPQGLVTP